MNLKIQQAERLKGLAQQLGGIADRLVEMPKKGGNSLQARKVELESLGVNRQAYALGLLYQTKMTAEQVGIEVGATRQTIHNWKRAKWRNKTR